jgi:hypothetical protein
MKNNNIIETIKDSMAQANKSRKEYSLNNIYVYLLSDMKTSKDSEPVSVTSVLALIKDLLPEHLMQEVDSIYIGQFETFKERDINAFYDSGAIYVSNVQENVKDMVTDIIHEFAHSLESKFGSLIYADGKLSREFLGKRKKLLLTMLKYEQFKGAKKYIKHFQDTEFNEELDNYFSKEIGYPTILNLTSEYLNTPYAITSLPEYYSTGFEDYFIDSKLREFLRMVSPALYKILKTLETGEQDGY